MSSKQGGKYCLDLSVKVTYKHNLTLVLLNPDMSCLCKQCISRSGSALFAIKYVDLYQQPGSGNMIGWNLDMGVAS